MIAFEVNDMTCAHCANTIRKAVASVDEDADVLIDVAVHRVEIGPSEATAQQFGNAIKDAGYNPVVIDAAYRPVAAQRSGCCCGRSRSARKTP